MMKKDRGENMNWTVKVERFINNLNKAETEFLLDYFKQEIADTVKEYQKMTKKSSNVKPKVLYNKFISKTTENITIIFSCSNCSFPNVHVSYDANVVPVSFGLTITNFRNNTMIDFSGSLSGKKLSEEEWSRVFTIINTLLSDHKRLLKYPEYRKELEAGEQEEGSISVEEETVEAPVEEAKEEEEKKDGEEAGGDN
jgi:hypothetical protein